MVIYLLFRISLKCQFLRVLLLILLIAVFLHLGWQWWLVAIPQPLPQEPTFNAGRGNSLLHGNYYEVSIPPTGSAQYLSADYRLWIPDGVQTVRGLIIKQHKCGGGSETELGLVYANDLQLQALAQKYKFALLGTKLPTDRQSSIKYPDNPCNSWADIERGSEDAFLKALRAFAQKSHHPELHKLPWVLWGYSGGADWSMQIAQKYPDLTIAVVAMRCGGVLLSYSEPSKLLASDINSAVLRVPVLFALGEKENSQMKGECLDLPKKVFSRYRKAGALWTLAVEPTSGHTPDDTRFLAIPYLDAILASRLTAHDTQLRQLDAAQGWLGNPTTHTIAPTNQYKGDPLEAAWLPNEETARKWQAYITTPSTWNRVGFMLCRMEKLSSFLGTVHLSKSCYPGKISPTQKPDAPTNVQVTNLGAKEAGLTWDFVPDLENGLPSFRVYRDKFLIATLQGQGLNYGDLPEPPHVVLEYRDKEATANAIYTVSAFNALGESVSTPMQFKNDATLHINPAIIELAFFELHKQ
jgi:pimeloyl-ACP methyl ester carboxylesterase